MSCFMLHTNACLFPQVFERGGCSSTMGQISSAIISEPGCWYGFVDPALLIRFCWTGSVDLALFSSQCHFPSHYPAARHRSGSVVTVWGHGFHSSLTLRDPGWTGAVIRRLSLTSQTWINTWTSSGVTLTQTISNLKLKSSPNHN